MVDEADGDEGVAAIGLLSENRLSPVGDTKRFKLGGQGKAVSSACLSEDESGG